MLIFSVVIFVFSTLTLSPVPLCLEKWGGVMTPSSYGSAAPEYWHWTDGRTGRRTELVKQYRALHALHADER